MRPRRSRGGSSLRLQPPLLLCQVCVCVCLYEFYFLWLCVCLLNLKSLFIFSTVPTGLAGVELLKILLSLPFDKYKSAFLNLSLPQFTFTEPGEVKKERITKNLYTTIWDRWDVHNGKEMTLSDFIDFVSDKWKIEPGAIFMGSFLIWNGLMPKHKTKLPMKMIDLIKDGKNMEYADLLVVVEEEEEEEEEGKEEEEGGGPTIRLYFD